MQPGFRVTHRRGRVAIDGAKVALSVDEGITHNPWLGQAYEGGIDHLLAVRVIVSAGVARDLGAFAEMATGTEIKLVHGVDDAPLGWLQAVTDVGQGATHDHAHRVIEIGLFELFFNLDVYYFCLVFHLYLHGSLSVTR